MSVWDNALTTIAEAKAFRSGATPQQCFRLVEQEIAQLAASEQWGSLRVETEPRPDEDGPGARGHCGILGLERGALPRPAYWARLGKLAGLATAAA